MSVLEKATQLIDCLGHAGEPMTLAQLRTELHMPKSSTHRLLAELAALGIVRRNVEGRYCLGPRLLYWGEVAAESFDLRVIADESMRKLRDELGESVHLYVREEDVRICIAAAEAYHELRPFIVLGRPLPLRAGAAGKLLLAFADEWVQSQELKRAREDDHSELADPPAERLVEQLERIREEHWAVSSGEREEGVAAAAASVRDSSGRVAAALAISGPSSRLTTKRLHATREPIQRYADEISRLLRGE